VVHLASTLGSVVNFQPLGGGAVGGSRNRFFCDEGPAAGRGVEQEPSCGFTTPDGRGVTSLNAHVSYSP
jgi:hypothetical protein